MTLITLYWYLESSSTGSLATGSYSEVVSARNKVAKDLLDIGWDVSYSDRKRSMLASHPTFGLRRYIIGRVQVPRTST